jgi:hypothetical protein
METQMEANTVKNSNVLFIVLEEAKMKEEEKKKREMREELFFGKKVVENEIATRNNNGKGKESINIVRIEQGEASSVRFDLVFKKEITRKRSDEESIFRILLSLPFILSTSVFVELKCVLVPVIQKWRLEGSFFLCLCCSFFFRNISFFFITSCCAASLFVCVCLFSLSRLRVFFVASKTNIVPNVD